MKQFLLPDPGEGLLEAEIVSWHVAPGDQVGINDILVEIETSKSIVELPSPYAGTVTELLVAEGDTVDVGAAIIAIDDAAEAAISDGSDQSGTDGAAATGSTESHAAPTEVAETAASPSGNDHSSGAPAGAESSGRTANLVGYGPRTAQARRRHRRTPGGAEEHSAVADAFGTHQPVSYHSGEQAPLQPGESQPIGAPLPEPGQPPAGGEDAGSPVAAKPPVRKLAKDLGVDLHTVTGTGPSGTITREDVSAAAAAIDIGGTPGARTRQDVRIPVRGVRKATAEAMVASAFTAPHVTEWITCDVSATMDLVEKVKGRREFDGVRVSPLLVIARACLLALRRTPAMNASWDAAAQEIVQHGRVNLGIAVASPRGLLVPTVRDADDLSLSGLAGAVQTMITTAREGRTQPADTSGGTFTITNVGVFGVDAGTPILNPGQSGILAVGSISRRPWVVGSGDTERIEPRWVTTLAVSFDHRIVDGEQGSRFLADVAAILSDPGMALVL